MRNQKGISLVELLATIVLLGIASTLTVMILVQIFHDNEKASEQITLKQKADLIVAQLNKSFYMDKTDKICLEPQGDELIVSAAGSDNDSDQIVTVEDGCITILDRTEPVEVALVLRNPSSNDKVELETTLFAREKKLTLDPEPVEADTGDPCNVDPNIKWEKVSTLPCSGDSISWNGNSAKSCSNYSFNNLKVTGQFDDDESRGMRLNVAKHAFFNEQVEFKNSNVTLGSGCFSSQFDATEGSSVLIQGNTTFKRQTTIKKSMLTVNRNATFKDQTDFKDSGHGVINGDALFKDQLQLDDRSSLTVTSNFAQTRDDTQLNDGSLLNVHGTASFVKRVQLSGHSKLCVKGDMKGAGTNKSSDCTY